MSSVARPNSIYKSVTLNAKRYNLTVVDEPGEFKMINKHKLMIDHSYQRNASKGRVKLINKDWSWLACGVIIVASREEGLFVVDGQHRVLAALSRADIEMLPCMVFKIKTIEKEAKGFLTAQVGRKPLTSYDKFSAQIIAGDENAIFVNQLLEKYDLIPGNYTAGSDCKTVKCLYCMIQWASYNKDVFEQVWPLIVEVCKGNVIKDRIVSGFAYLANHSDGEGILTPYWKQKIISIPYQRYIEGIRKAMGYYGSGGERTSALGIIDVINHGRKSKINLKNNDI